MHTQTASVSEHPARLAPSLQAATGLGLYLLTLAGEAVLGAGVRWLLTYVGAAALGAIVPLGLGAAQLALLAAFGPLAWSLLGLALPGGGLVWPRRIGARRPSAEEAAVVADAHALLRGVDPDLPDVSSLYVLDDPLPAGAARGRSVALTRGLLETEAVAPVLAHELSHTRTLDGRLTEALDRLELWGDPLRLPESPAARDREVDEHRSNGLLAAALRWTLRLAGGGVAALILSPLWAAYWRAREYAADAHAAALGQGEDLARHLADYDLPLDLPQRRFPFDLSEHPPVAHRIERLSRG
jgi:Zn-dependent protease with chaperone function